MGRSSSQFSPYLGVDSQAPKHIRRLAIFYAPSRMAHGAQMAAKGGRTIVAA